MQILRWCFRTFVYFAIFSLPFLFIAAQPMYLAAQDTEQVKIVIRKSTYEYHGGVLKPNVPVTVVLQNLDDEQHGFTSSLFDGLNVEVEANGGVAFGKGIKGVHIDPGEVMQIRFIPIAQGEFKFQCDLHPFMKGELLILSVGSV
jgi:hypothetical protein